MSTHTSFVLMVAQRQARARSCSWPTSTLGRQAGLGSGALSNQSRAWGRSAQCLRSLGRRFRPLWIVVEGKLPEDWHRGDGTKVEEVYAQRPPRLGNQKAEGVRVARNGLKHTVVSCMRRTSQGRKGDVMTFQKLEGRRSPGFGGRRKMATFPGEVDAHLGATATGEQNAFDLQI